ncbi:MAG: M13 family metallopeptidase [Bacteroidia bacterium]|nr:M13 family metallopeptidase [Bacteroidia bacterium]
MFLKKFQHYMIVALAVAMAVCCGCSTSTESKLAKGVGINLENMDTTVRPADDFFLFVNGGWIARTEIPADQGRWGSFSELGENTRNDVLAVLKESATGDQYPDGSDQRKASDFFAIGMDSAQAEAMGIKPIQPYLDKINAITTPLELQKYLVEQQRVGTGAFFGIFVNNDLKKSDQVALYIGASGLGLPERDYYTKTDPKSAETREKYVKHMTDMFVLAGEMPQEAANHADAIMVIETALANNTMTKEDRRDPNKRYNKRSIAQLQSIVPSVNWDTYLKDLGISGMDSVIISDLGFMDGLPEVFAKTKMENVRAYLRWKLIDMAAPFLNYALVVEDFEFNTKYLRGIEELRPRWKRVLDATNGTLGEAIGKLYVDKNFPPEAKQKAIEMVENIKLAFAERIKGLDWMSDSTKAKALNKLSTFSVKIGYPDEWRDYAGLQVDKNPEKASYAQNVINGRKFNMQRMLDKLGKPVDKKEWRMTPQTVNAYYNPTFNEIVFPAAILQPPFYDYRADDAVNYGGIGAVIGHEISHGFDDQGSKFDAEGNLKNWWTDEDLEKFQTKGNAYAAQFDAYEPLKDVHVQGKFTLGENIGDLGGVAVAYAGLQRYLKEHGSPGLIDGFTPEQRFFISWATIWRIKYKEESLRTQVQTDPHAPAMYRANGPLSNNEDFYTAFSVKPGDKMYRADSVRVKIW